MRPSSFVSFVVLTLNSFGRIQKCLDGITRINYPTEMYEIVVVDGGSTDGTVEIAENYGAKVVEFKGKNKKNKRILGLTRGLLSKSRNIGLANSDGEYIAFVDDDVQIASDWLKLLLEKGFKVSEVAAATGLHYVPMSNSRIGKYIGVLPIQPPSIDSLDPIPLSRSPYVSEMITEKSTFRVSTKACLYRKAALLRIGGFDENLYWGEDPDVTTTLIKNGYKLAFVPEAKDWHQPRQNICAFAKQQIRAGFGRAHNIQKHPEWLEPRSVILLIGMITILGLVFFSIIAELAMILLGCILVFFALFSVSYGIRAALKYRNFDMLFGVPLVFTTWQFCWFLGFTYGMFFRRYSN